MGLFVKMSMNREKKKMNVMRVCDFMQLSLRIGSRCLSARCLFGS